MKSDPPSKKIESNNPHQSFKEPPTFEVTTHLDSISILSRISDFSENFLTAEAKLPPIIDKETPNIDRQRFLILETMAQSGSLFYKNKINFSSHTFLSSIKMVAINKTPNIEQFQIRVGLLLATTRSIRCKITATSNDGAIIAEGNFSFSKLEWSDNFKKEPIKQLNIDRFNKLCSQGTKNA